MYRLDAHITVGSLIFKYVSNVEIESSWKNQTDTCRIEFPRNLFLRSPSGRKPLNELISPGDQVEVSLGYDGILVKEFSGFVARVSPTLPISIECEDKMWELKQKEVEFSQTQAELKDVLGELYDGPIDAFDALLGSFRVKATASLVLDKIKESYGLYSFFRGDLLVTGKPYEKSASNLFRFDLKLNVIDNGLTFRSKKEVKLKVKAISILPDNTKIETEVGDSGGEERTLHFYDIQSESKLKALAENELSRLQYDGYRGDFTAFGLPSVSHGDRVRITGDDYGDSSGEYYIDSVRKTFGSGGYRQTIALGPKSNLN